MPRTCTVCRHPQRVDIDHALVAGQPYRRIAAQFGTSEPAVRRHKGDHLHDLLAQAKQRHADHEAALGALVHEQEVTRIEQAIDVVQQLRLINQESVAILQEARTSGQPLVALKAVERIQKQVELQARLIGELDERPQVNVLVSSDWAAIRSTLLEVLRPYPEARTAVAEHLLLLEGSQG